MIAAIVAAYALRLLKIQSLTSETGIEASSGFQVLEEQIQTRANLTWLIFGNFSSAASTSLRLQNAN